jgi:hypothetical protein
VDELLAALGYVGDTLSKPGRAVRGVLGGRPEEILAAVPFSDSMGITDRRNQVTGHMLLEQLGVDPGDDWMGVGAGIGLDIATDPLTYAGGALVGAGARALGRAEPTLTSLLGGRLAGTRAAGQVDDSFRLGDPNDILQLPEAGPLTAMADIPQPGLGAQEFSIPQFLDEVPSPDRYALDIGYGPGSWLEGAPHDMLLQGDKLGAFQASIGGWNNVVKDLNRLSPQARGSMIGTADFSDDYLELRNLPPDVELSENGRLWQQLLADRRGDLAEMQILIARGAAPADLAPVVDKQLAQLDKFSSWSAKGVSTRAMYDLDSGTYKPSIIPGLLADPSSGLGHLPLDPVVMRRLAAEAQMDDLLGTWTGRLGSQFDEFGQPGFNPSTIEAIADRDDAIPALVELLDPSYWKRSHYEPSIVDSFFRNPPADEFGSRVGQARTLLDRLQRGEIENLGAGMPAGMDLAYADDLGEIDVADLDEYLGVADDLADAAVPAHGLGPVPAGGYGDIPVPLMDDLVPPLDLPLPPGLLDDGDLLLEFADDIPPLPMPPGAPPVPPGGLGWGVGDYAFGTRDEFIDNIPLPTMPEFGPPAAASAEAALGLPTAGVQAMARFVESRLGVPLPPGTPDEEIIAMFNMLQDGL